MIRRLRELLLWAGAGLGLVGIVTGVAVAFLGVDLLVFRSGSMAPDIPTGALAVARTVPATELDEGDVVSVIAAGGQRVTHRVVSSTVSDGRASLVLKGDANSVADPEPYDVASAERVVFAVPLGGYVLAHALTPPGLVAAGAVALMLVVIAFSPSEPAHPRPAPRGGARRRERRDGHVRTAVVMVAVAGTVAAVASGAGVTGTWALFTDRATLTSGSFASGSVELPTPPALSQTAGTGAAAITWGPTAVGGSTAARYDVVRYSTATGGTGTVVCANVTTPRSCTEPKPATAASSTTYYYAVNAKYPVNWSKESTTRTPYTPDVVAPTGSYTTPSPTASNTSCGAASACGTAADPAGVAKVEFTLLRTRLVAGILLPTYDCWTGTAYQGNGTSATCPTFYAATGTTTWSVPGPRSTVYGTALATTQSFSLVIRLSDTFGNVFTSAPINY